MLFEQNELYTLIEQTFQKFFLEFVNGVNSQVILWSVFDDSADMLEDTNA